MQTKISGIAGTIAALAMLWVASAPVVRADQAPAVPAAAERLAEAIRFQTITSKPLGRYKEETEQEYLQISLNGTLISRYSRDKDPNHSGRTGDKHSFLLPVILIRNSTFVFSE